MAAGPCPPRISKKLRELRKVETGRDKTGFAGKVHIFNSFLSRAWPSTFLRLRRIFSQLESERY